MKAGQFDSLYIHVPFCRNICDYCALYSVVENSPEVRQRYLKRLRSDLDKNRASLSQIKTIFIGGGTPSALPRRIARVTLGFE